MGARRYAIIATASGSGKTTLGRDLADRLEVPFVELDAWVHGPAWVETPDAELRARLEPVLAGPGWVIDGGYQHKLGTRVLDAAEVVIWLDPPTRVWLSRLLRRTVARIARREELWNGNRQTWRHAFWGRDSLFRYAVTQAPRRRREWPLALARYPVVRLRSTAEVERFLSRLT